MRISIKVFRAGFVLFVAVFCLFYSYSEGRAECPSPQKVEEGFSKVFRRGGKVLQVKESGLPGLCEVQVEVAGKTGTQKGIIYTDSSGSYIVMGQILDAKTGANLTRQAMAKLNRMNPDEIKKLDSLVAFSAGQGEKTFFYVTDPQCPYCKKGEEVLKKLIDEDKVTVKFIFFPLAMHKGAKEQCISIICDDKGLEGLESKYKSENQCEAGIKKVDESIAFLKSKGISGTPVYIFPDGMVHSGLLREAQLLKQLGLPVPKPEAASKPAPAPKAEKKPESKKPEEGKKQ